MSDSNAATNTDTTTSDKDVLIVVSKLKNYIRATSDMNTSGNVADKLSEIIRSLCQQAISNAKNDGRKTVMDRDFLGQ